MKVHPPNIAFLNIAMLGDGSLGLIVVSWVLDSSLCGIWSDADARMLQVMSTNADSEKAAINANSG